MSAISTERALIGPRIGGGIGFVLGLLNGISRPAETLLDSSLQMLRNIPHLAMIPLVILWFGIDEEAKIFLVAVGVAVPDLPQHLPRHPHRRPGLIEMARVYGLGRLALFWRVILPGALPSILVGLRYALGIMWLTLIVAETISASSGIGYMTMNAREFLQTDVVVLGIIVYALLGKLADVAHPADRAARRSPGIRPTKRRGRRAPHERSCDCTATCLNASVASVPHRRTPRRSASPATERAERTPVGRP